MQEKILSKRKEMDEAKKNIREWQIKLNHFKHEYSKLLEEKKDSIIKNWEKYFGVINFEKDFKYLLSSTPCEPSYFDYRKIYLERFNNSNNELIEQTYNEISNSETINLFDGYKLKNIQNEWVVIVDEYIDLEEEYEETIIVKDKDINFVIKKFSVLKELNFLEDFKEDYKYINY